MIELSREFWLDVVETQILGNIGYNYTILNTDIDWTHYDFGQGFLKLTFSDPQAETLFRLKYL